MKTSDKLLIGFLLISCGIFTAVQLSLYANFRKGNITSANILLGERATRFKLPSPQFIFVKGFQNISVIPSDSFFIEIEKLEGGRAGFRFIDDTLFIEGDTLSPKTFLKTITSPIRKDLLYFPNQIKPKSDDGSSVELGRQELILHCPSVKKIIMENGQIFFHGNTDPPKYDFDMDIVGCQLNFGNAGVFDTTYTNRFYNRVKIHSFRSFVALSNRAVINQLDISLDNQSELTDNQAVIQHIFIDCAGESKTHLSGENLRKAKISQ